MRRVWFTSLFVAVFLGLTRLALADGTARSVIVRTAQLRAAPQHWASPVAAVQYGDRLSVLTSQGDWLSVKNDAGVSGFIHTTAVSTRTVVLQVGAANQADAVGESEVVLAGKGFSDELEASLREQQATLRFDRVDEMEKLRVSREDVAAFLRTGGLSLD